MRLTTLILIASLVQVSASTLAQKITLNRQNTKLETVLQDIRKQSGYDIYYDSKDIAPDQKISVKVTNADVQEALTSTFKNLPLTFDIDGKIISIKKKDPTFLDNIKAAFAAIDVHGRVVDETGKPLPGVTIRVKDGSNATVTDIKGEFSIKRVDEKSILIFSFIGYLTKEVNAISDLGIIKLEVSTSKLDEVQVQAYGTTSLRLSTGNISTIKAEDIAKSPVSNPLLAIEGRVPGIFIQQSSGVPGAGVQTLIQGQTSINNSNDPFYVIDGVPYTSQLLPGLTNELGPSGAANVANNAIPTNGNPLNFINPLDIESIDILKDADATSIYGSRAANGAIVITTKKGRIGKTVVNIDLQQGAGVLGRKVDMLNTAQYLDMRREAFENDGLDIPTAPTPGLSDLTFWDQNKFTDWQKVLLGGTAKYTNANLSISGGTNNVQYLLSGNYHREGTITPSDLNDQKGSIHFNLSSTSDNQRLKFNFSGNYLTDKNKLASVQALVSAAYTLPPNAPNLRNADGSINWAYLPDGTTSSFDDAGGQPLALLNSKYINSTSHLLANFNISYQLGKSLQFKSLFGYDRLEASEINAIPLSVYSPPSQAYLTRTADFNNSSVGSWIIEPQFVFQKTVGPGKLDAILGATIQDEKRDRTYLTSSGYISDQAILNIKAASTVQVAGSPDAVILSTYRYNAGFARASYNIQDKYLFSASLRRDGSSRFGSANRFHDFASIAGGWVFSDENFLNRNDSPLSFGKVKISYGTTGNDKIGDYTYLNIYNNVPNIGTPYQGIVSLQPSSGFPNPYIQWESTKKLSAGLDLGFFKDRITAGLNYYRNTSSNQLINKGVVTTTGGNSVTENLPAVVRNYGFEGQLTTINIRSKNLKWTTGFNITINRNRLVSYGDFDLDAKSSLIGKPLSIQQMFHFIGVDPTTGLYTFADHNGGITTTPDESLDKIAYVDINPKFFGGFLNTISFKNITFDFLLQFAKQLAFAPDLVGNFPGLFANNQPRTILDRWIQPGDQVSIQRYSAMYQPTSSSVAESDKLIMDASYIKLKNVSISYSMPNSVTQKLHLNSARIFAQGQNIFTWSHYLGDPETKTLRSAMGTLRVMTLGIQIGI